MARHGAIGCLRWTFADHNLRRDEGLAPPARARSRCPQHPSSAQAGRQLAAQCTAPLNEQRLVDGLMADAHGLIVREVDRQAASDLLRAPGSCPLPVFPRSMPTAFPGYGRAGNSSPAWSDNNASQSFLHIGSQGRIERKLRQFGTASGSCHCAVVARYSRPPLRVAALRRNSREIVEAARPSRRATSCMEQLCARRSAISSRSANERYRPESGFADGLDIDGGIPPAFLNHRVPTACDTPASTAASSLARPAAIAAQNRRRSSRPAIGGRPGENNGGRPDRSERRFRADIATSSRRVLRRPLESAQFTSVEFTSLLRDNAIAISRD